MRQTPVALPVSSFMAEAQGRPPEVAQLWCVSLTETAAEWQRRCFERCLIASAAKLTGAFSSLRPPKKSHHAASPMPEFGTEGRAGG
jgi:hypothetical protein